MPYADHETFQKCTRTMVTAPDKADVVHAADKLIAYLGRLVLSKADSPGDDLISTLLAEHCGQAG